MIDFELVKIVSLTDYTLVADKLAALLPNANHTHLINELKARLDLQVNTILIEYPYRDFDFSSVYTAFYTKKHQAVSRDCARLHFFSNDNIEQKTYMGNIVVRDSSVDSRGRGTLVPSYLITNTKSCILKAPIKSHILGLPLVVDTFPWMAQDTDIAVCAHVAVWSVANYFALKYANYQSHSIARISETTQQYLGRKTPSEGLNLLQVSDLLSKLGFFPLVLKKQSNQDIDFFRAVYSYVESGIPIVGAMTSKGHAVAIIGHGDINALAFDSTVPINYVADALEDFVISNDNELPFTTITKSNNKYTFDDLDYVIVPLYEKMYLNATIVYKRVEALINSKTINIATGCVLRVYLTSARSLKRKAINNKSMDLTLKSILLKLHTPQFIWCADIASIADYADNKTAYRVLIDSTAGTYEDEPWLLFHDDERIIYKDTQPTKSSFKQVIQKIPPYAIYRNNLKEV